MRIRSLVPEEWPRYREMRLRALEESPDAFGSTLESERLRPDEHWAERVRSGASSGCTLPLVAEKDGELVGLVWGRIEPSAPETAHVFQMWVAPESRRLGLGSTLLETVIGWAKKAGAQRIVLSVTCGDTPAWRQYTRAGFRPCGEPEPLRQGTMLRSQRMCLELA